MWETGSWFIRFPGFTEFNEISDPFRKNSTVRSRIFPEGFGTDPRGKERELFIGDSMSYLSSWIWPHSEKSVDFWHRFIGIGWKWLVFRFIMILCSTIYVGRWGLTIRKCKKVTHARYGGHAIWYYDNFFTEYCVEKKLDHFFVGSFSGLAWSLNQSRSWNHLRINLAV